jgi:SnoaL-like domain
MVPRSPGGYFSAVDDGSRAQDVSRITALIYGYSELIDSGDIEGLADVLADAGFGTFEEPLLRGRDRILDLYRNTVMIYDDGTPRTRHVVSNLVVDLEEPDSGPATSATARSYFTVLQAATPGSLVPIVAGRYHDRFTKTDGVWRFSERRISTDLVGDVSAHMLPAARHLVTGGD